MLPTNTYLPNRTLFCPILNRPLFDAVKLEPCGHSCSQEAAKQMLIDHEVCQIDLENVEGYTIDHRARLLTAGLLTTQSGFAPIIKAFLE